MFDGADYSYSSFMSFDALQAFVVEGRDPDAPCVIVFESDMASAIALGRTASRLEKVLDLQAEPLPELDHLAAIQLQPRLVEGRTREELRVIRNLNWKMAGALVCSCCHKFESTRLPESRLRKGLCAECRRTPVEPTVQNSLPGC